MSHTTSYANLPVEILEYLVSHPDIFVHHPELLAGLNIPHAGNKDVTSLIEYQVNRLRLELDALRNTVSGMEFGAVHHKKQVEDIHALALVLLKAQTPQDLYQILQRDLKTCCSANRVLLLIFTGAKANTNHAGLRFYNTGVEAITAAPIRTSLRFMFSELFYRGQPLCGSLQEEHLQALFGANSEKIKSTLLLPYAGDGWQELLVLGSHAENRYCYGLELDLIRFINDILCQKIPAWPGEISE